MGLLERLDRWLWAPERHAIDKVALWNTGADVIDEVHAQVPVTQTGALQMIAVYACVRIRSETIAALPADVFRKRGDVREEVDLAPQWLRQPNPENTWFELVEQINRGLDLDGNAYLLITARDFQGFPAELWTLNPQEVAVKRENRKIIYTFGGDQTLSAYSPTNPTGDVLHIRNLSAGGLKGLSPIGVARQGIGLALAAEKQGARFYGRGQTLSGVLEFDSANQGVTQKNIDLTKANWKRKHAGTDRSFEPGILVGAKWKPISVNPDEAQFLETRRFQIAEIARLYGVPLHMIQEVSGTTSWGTGIEAMTTQFFVVSIMTRLARLESAFNLLTPRGQFIKWNVTGLLRGDARSRAEFYAKAIQNGWMTRNEVRALEDMKPLAGLDAPLIQSSLIPSGTTPQPSQNGQVPVEVTP